MFKLEHKITLSWFIIFTSWSAAAMDCIWLGLCSFHNMEKVFWFLVISCYSAFKCFSLSKSLVCSMLSFSCLMQTFVLLNSKSTYSLSYMSLQSLRVDGNFWYFSNPICSSSLKDHLSYFVLARLRAFLVIRDIMLSTCILIWSSVILPSTLFDKFVNIFPYAFLSLYIITPNYIKLYKWLFLNMKRSRARVTLGGQCLLLQIRKKMLRILKKKLNIRMNHTLPDVLLNP